MGDSEDKQNYETIVKQETLLVYTNSIGKPKREKYRLISSTKKKYRPITEYLSIYKKY